MRQFNPGARTPSQVRYIMLLVVDPCVCGPPVTDPPAASCCCTAWVSCGLVVVAVQPACPLAMDADNALTETPHTFAATSIGTCAFTGMFARSTLMATERSLRTFWRLTLTSVGMLDPPPVVPPAPAPVLPGSVDGAALTSPAELGAVVSFVLQPATASVTAVTASPI